MSTGASLSLSKHRIEALADGVFAIVVTLIVLEMRLPEIPRTAASAQIAAALRHLALPLFSFVVTFVLAGSFWALHQWTLHFVREVDGVLLWLNIGFLMFVSLLPFSTGILSRFKLGTSIPLAVYFGNQFLIAALLWLQWQYMRRSGLLIVGAETSPKARDLPARVGALAFGAGLALVMSSVAPRMAFYSFVIPTIAARALRLRRSRFAGGSYRA